MSRRYFGGYLSATSPNVSLTSASGSWSTQQAMIQIGQGVWPSLNSNPLYSFTSFTFTSATATGINGPTLAQCQTAYTGQAFLNGYFSMPSFQGYQLWTVPKSGTYRITAAGASSETAGGGRPAIVRADIDLYITQKLWICVGQQRADATNAYGMGGGSFVAWAIDNVVPNSIPLIVAGGSGCSSYYSFETSYQTGRQFADAQLTTNIDPSVLNCAPYIPATPVTGQGGTVTTTAAPGYGQSGAGWNGDSVTTTGSTTLVSQAKSFFNGLVGGDAEQDGAFGAAGARAGPYGTGGGGGYTGGSFAGNTSPPLRRSTGGSCYVTGANQSLTLGTAGTAGYVTIQSLT